MIPHLRFACRHATARLSRRTALTAALAFAAAGTVSAATTENWTGATSSAWSDKTNWDGGAVPAWGDTVNVDKISPNAANFNDGSTTGKLGAVTLGITGTSSLSILAASHLVATQFSIGDGANANGTTTIADKGALNVANDVYVGNKGTGTLTVQKSGSGGGTVMDSDGWIGKAQTGTGTVTVDGPGSVWTNFFNLSVGDYGVGTLNITHGGAVSDSTASVGGNNPTSGPDSTVIVSDPGSNWSTAGSLVVGVSGAGGLQVLNGATASSADSVLGSQDGSTGYATVDQAGSKWNVQGVLTVGDVGNGSVIVTNGGAVSAIRAILGNSAGSIARGNVLVDSGGSFTVSGDMVVAAQSASSVILSGGGNLKVSGALNIGTGMITGALAIGNYISGVSSVPLPPKPPGMLTLPGTTVTLGGHGAIFFNHNASAPYVFPHILAAPAGGSGGTVNVYAGPTSFTADSSAFTGNTFVYGGTLFVNGKLGTGVVTVNGGTLGGNGNIAGPVTVQSGGAVAPGNSPGTLTTGALTLNPGAVLDYDLGAPGTIGGGINDLLVVNGNLALAGTLNIANAGGFAAGTYRLINYTGALSGGALSIGTIPTGFSASQMQIDTSTPGQINLVVSGSAATPALALAPSSLSWGSVPAGGSGGVQSVTLTNTGTMPVTINSIATPLNPPFVPGGGTCAAPPFTLAAGASCSLAYDFKPTAAGTFSSSPQISSNAPAGPTDVLLSGAAVAATAPALTIAPTNLSWTNVAVGAVGAALSATLTNTGTAPLTVNSISAASPPFAANGGTCAAPPFTLAAGAGCSLAYRFKPTAAGGFSSTVSVGSNAPGGSTSFGLNGTAVATAPALAIAPASLSWGSVPVGDSGGTKTVVLGNTGNATLTVNSISAPLAPFVAQSGTCPAPPFTLAVGANCSLAYDFQPGATGSFGATIDLASDAPGNPNSPGPATIALDGAGIVIPQRPPTVAAPTTSPAMLFVLALMLGGCGAWLLYRHQAGRDLPSR